MMTSGLVVTLQPKSSVEAIEALSADPSITVGTREGDLLAVVLETDGAQASEGRFDWIRNLPGVIAVEVVFVHWDTCEAEAIHAGA